MRTTQPQERPDLSVLPAGYFARPGGVELSAAEQALVEGFRLMGDEARASMLHFFRKQVERDRAQRIAAMAPRLSLVKGGGA